MSGIYLISREWAGNAVTVVRKQENKERSVTLVNGKLTETIRREKQGVSALLYGGGKRGFAAVPGISEASVKKARQMARANLSAILPRGKALPLRKGKEYRYLPVGNDCGQMVLLETARQVDSFIQESCPGLLGRKVHIASLSSEREIRCSGGRTGFFLQPRTNIMVTLIAEGKNGRPVSVRDSVGGIGFVSDLPMLMDRIRNMLADMHEDLMQKRSPLEWEPGEYPCIFGDGTGILIHEAFGHIAEADDVLAGSVLAGRIGQQVASPLISATDFASSAFGESVPQTLLLDDEGNECVDAPLIKDGVLAGYMTDYATADVLGLVNTGNARAESYEDLPQVRMRNTAIHPGKSTLDEMISSTENGVYLKRTGAGQADSMGKYLFAVQMAYRIQNGRITGALPDVSCQGDSFDTLKKVSMVGDRLVWKHSSLCGKGGQVIPVGMSGPAIKTVSYINGG